MNDERPQVVDAVHVIGVLVREKHRIEPRDVRVEELLTQYMDRIAREFHAALPPADKAGH